jgi:predicted nucleotidyltransferase
MIESIRGELDLITDAIIAATPVEAVYLFGSYAYGQPTAESDLDIYVVVPDSDIDTLDLGWKIRMDLLDKITIPMDLLFGKKSNFDYRKDLPTLENIIKKQGVILYGN